MFEEVNPFIIFCELLAVYNCSTLREDVIRMNKLMTGILGASLALVPTISHADPVSLGMIPGGFELQRDGETCMIISGTHGGNGRVIVIGLRRDHSASYAAFFDPSYSLTMGDRYPYQAKFAGWKDVPVQGVTTHFGDVPGILFAFTGEGVFDIAEHSVTFARDGKDVFGLSFGFQYHDAFDRLIQCTNENPNPFAR